MIVDGHVSVDRDRFPVDRLIPILSSANIGQAVIFADARAQNIEAQNAYVLRAAQEHDLLPFYYIGGNPFTDTRPDSLDLPNNIGDYRGIRWHRWIGEDIDRRGELDESELDWAVGLMESAEFEAITAAAAHYNLPIIFEESFSVTLEFALRYPSIDIIVPHLGARSGGEARVLRAMWDMPHVYFGTELASLDEAALSRIGSERLLFGSGLPEGDPEIELERVESLPVSDTAKESIFGNNILSLLGEDPL